MENQLPTDIKPCKKVIFIELDGASWNIMDPLLQQGRLPHIQRLMQRGAAGVLASDPPLLSPRLWVSIFTGKHSHKHGIEFFGNSSSMVKCRRIWDIFHEKGFVVGVFGSFVTWPPYPVRGYMIPSLFALGPETYPRDYGFLQELTLSERGKGKPGLSTNGNRRSLLYYAAQMKAHGVSARTLGEIAFSMIGNTLKRSPADERYWKRAIAHMKVSTEIFLHLYRYHQPRFATFHIHICDAFAHRYWKYYEPEKFDHVDDRLVKRYHDVIPNAYIEADKAIGKILKVAGNDLVMVISDHGSTALKTSRTSYRLHVENFLNRFRLRKKVIPAHVGLMTFCYFHDTKLIQEMGIVLEKVSFSDSGERVFDVVREESLLGLRLSQEHWGVEIHGERPIDLQAFGTCKFQDLFLLQKMEVTGTHQEEGVLLMAGPNIKRNCHITGAHIFDITPTALMLSGLPVGKDMDGKVLTEAIRDDFLGRYPMEFIESYDDSEGEVKESTGDVTYDQIKGRLKALGYL